MQQVTQQHRELYTAVKSIIYPWRGLVIAVDGRDHSGKTTIASFIAWQFAVPVIYSDFYIVKGERPLRHDYTAISRLVAGRHEHNWPVIVEGVKLLETLQSIGCAADFLVQTVNTSNHGSLGEELTEYHEQFRPAERAHFVFRWTEHG